MIMLSVHIFVISIGIFLE